MLLLLLPCESKVNSQVWPGMGVLKKKNKKKNKKNIKKNKDTNKRNKKIKKITLCYLD